MEVTKPWQSKTVMVNAVLGVLAAVAVFVPAASGIQEFINSHGAEIGIGWSILNILLRAVTKNRLGLGD